MKLIALPLLVALSNGLPASGQTPAGGKTQTPIAARGDAKGRTPPRTSWDVPDLQGVWDFRTITPLQRPKVFGTRQFLTDEEAAKFEEEENRRLNRDLIDPKKGGALYPPGGVVPYNEFWYDRGNKVVGTKRTSLIVDPPDGRLPPRTPEGEKRDAQAAEEDRYNQAGKPRADSYEQRDLTERCIQGLNSGPPMTSNAYNNNVQIVQTRQYVVLLTEMIHDARIVPMDGQPHGNVRRAQGDSRGRWEGNTLVVSTKNFTRGTSLPGSTASMHVIERFTLVDASTLLYEFTVTDPAQWTRPWTAQMPMTRSAQPIYEYACHEANYGLEGVLKGARAADQSSP